MNKQKKKKKREWINKYTTTGPHPLRPAALRGGQTQTCKCWTRRATAWSEHQAPELSWETQATLKLWLLICELSASQGIPSGLPHGLAGLKRVPDICKVLGVVQSVIKGQGGKNPNSLFSETETHLYRLSLLQNQSSSNTAEQLSV